MPSSTSTDRRARVSKVVTVPSVAVLALTTLLGVVGFAAGTTFYSSITVSLRAREALLPALAFPILVPVVIATVRATAALVAGGWSPEVTTWLTFLAAFDVGTIILATLLFPYALEG